MEKIIEYVKKARVGDNEAIKELYNLTIHTSYFMARKFIKDEQDANDVVQDAYITAFKKISQLEDDSKFPNWLNRIVANKAKDYLKKKKPTVFSNITSEEQNVEEFLEDETIEFKPKDQYEYEELKIAMSDIIDNLSEENRMCILMYYFQGLSVGEIADTLELSSGTIKSRLNYGRKHIKKEVETLEAKGVKFRGVAPIPFMVWMFNEFAASTKISSSIWMNVNGNLISKSLEITPTKGSSKIAKQVLIKLFAGSLAICTIVVGVFLATNDNEESKELENNHNEEVIEVEEAPEFEFEQLLLSDVNAEISLLSGLEKVEENDTIITWKSKDDDTRFGPEGIRIDMWKVQGGMMPCIHCGFNTKENAQDAVNNLNGQSYNYFITGAEDRSETTIESIYKEDGEVFATLRVSGVMGAGTAFTGEGGYTYGEGLTINVDLNGIDNQIKHYLFVITIRDDQSNFGTDEFKEKRIRLAKEMFESIKEN
ncbi:RNA polymerase sigma factor [Breznakia pachnodae]|uniref:RNA polymerase sigma factor (Sigma-70 family) n=1 Tax=Breznakia pachnodae TaxID=265178 RepID=A0ABU0E3X5_9FIRM|nr:RNA polymerase sigma factor [Breznakia pachnodae]MDQ0361500.1 RNA polymerase sigma factor (sigma-70 family) [Breznakia pachnodae]